MDEIFCFSKLLIKVPFWIGYSVSYFEAMKKRVLVYGGCGALGKELVSCFKKSEKYVRVNFCDQSFVSLVINGHFSGFAV
jgi:hypothetical protein